MEKVQIEIYSTAADLFERFLSSTNNFHYFQSKTYICSKKTSIFSRKRTFSMAILDFFNHYIIYYVHFLLLLVFVVVVIYLHL